MPVARAIVEAVLAQQLGGADPALIEGLDTTARQVAAKVEGMSRFMATAMLSATLVFDATAGPTPFRAQSIPDRQAALARWRQAPVGVLRDFVMFWEKMTVFVYYCQREEAAGHHVDSDK